MFGKKGKIEIKVNKFNFSPGDVVDGVVELTLKKPINARGLKVGFFGMKRSHSVSVFSNSSRRSEQVIFRFEQPLDGEKEYSATNQPLLYPFKIKIPPDVLNRDIQPHGALETITKATDVLTGTIRNTSWYLEAKLDVPKKGDVRKVLQINLA